MPFCKDVALKQWSVYCHNKKWRLCSYWLFTATTKTLLSIFCQLNNRRNKEKKYKEISCTLTFKALMWRISLPTYSSHRPSYVSWFDQISHKYWIFFLVILVQIFRPERSFLILLNSVRGHILDLNHLQEFHQYCFLCRIISLILSKYGCVLKCHNKK